MPMSPFIFIPRTALKTDMPPENILDYDLSDKAAQDKEKVDEMVAAGMSRAEAAAEFTGDAAFEEWYDSWYQKLNDTAHSNQ